MSSDSPAPPGADDERARVEPLPPLAPGSASGYQPPQPPNAGEGRWSIEPRLGVVASYISNPQLRVTDAQAEDNVAVTADLPLRYDTDQMDFLLRPNGRRSNRQGYSSLASNYEHLDATAQFNSELDAATLLGAVARDSSLYYVGGLVHGIGVPRDSVNGSANWTHSVTERQQVLLDASWTRVRYVEPSSFNAQVNYRYLSAGPTFSAAVSERNTLKLLGTYGLYQSLNGLTESRSENLQMAFVRRLTEIWTLSASAGYSRSIDSQKLYQQIPYGPFILGTVLVGVAKSNQNGAVYAANFTRQGERFNLSIAASRALQPTGFAFLSRQDSLTLSASYILTERWDFSAAAQWVRAANPIENTSGAALSGTESRTSYRNIQLAANWHLTPQWMISFSAARIMQQYDGYTVPIPSAPALYIPSSNAGSTNISLTFTRQFWRTQF